MMAEWKDAYWVPRMVDYLVQMMAEYLGLIQMMAQEKWMASYLEDHWERY